MARTVTPDGEKIAKLRLGKGWNVSEFANKAFFSEKTVASLENSKPVYMETIKKAAKAFAVAPASLLASDSDSHDAPPTEEHIELTTTITGAGFPAFEQFDESTDLIALIRGWENVHKIVIIYVNSVTKSSIIITVSVSLRDAFRWVSDYNTQVPDETHSLLPSPMGDYWITKLEYRTPVSEGKNGTSEMAISALNDCLSTVYMFGYMMRWYKKMQEERSESLTSQSHEAQLYEALSRPENATEAGSPPDFHILTDQIRELAMRILIPKPRK